MPRHAEVEDQGVAAVGADQPEFRAAAEAGDRCAGQPLAEIFGECAAQVGPAHLDPRQPAPVEHALQPADGRLDFGKFGHAPRYGEGRQAR